MPVKSLKVESVKSEVQVPKTKGKVMKPVVSQDKLQFEVDKTKQPKISQTNIFESTTTATLQARRKKLTEQRGYKVKLEED